MRFKLFSILLAMGAQVFAATPYLPFSIDVEKSGDDRQFDIQSRVLSTPTLRFYTLQGTNVFNPQGYVSTFSFAEDWNATNMVKITGSNYSSYIDFSVSSNDFAYPIDKWYASILLTKPADGGVFSWAYGYISLKPSPEANANASFFYTHAINGSEYGPFTGSFTNWPFVLSGAFLGGYVDIPLWTTTNILFEGRIKTNETDISNIKLTNSIIQSNLTAEISRATNTEAVASNYFEIKINAEISRATNVETVVSNYATTAISVETSRATNAETVISNAYVAAIAVETSRATNAETIISNSIATAVAVEASRATNIETMISNAYVAAIAVETSRATNAETVISNTFNSAYTNQAITNASFSSRISSNETFRTTTQPATNAYFESAKTNLQAQITALASSTNVSTLSRYDAYPAAANTIWVFATSTNVTAVRAASTFTFTIPSGTRLLAVKIRVDGSSTDSGKIYLSMGTNDMNNSSTVNNWIPVCNATRDDTYANVPVTAQTYSGDNSQIVISGLGTVGGIFYHVELRF